MNLSKPEPKYEIYRERMKILERREGAVYRTESLGHGWFDEELVKANKPSETDIMYVVPSSEHPGPSVLIRKKR